MTTQSRAEQRKERYAQLRAAGFSPAEARRRRDWAQPRITTEINRQRQVTAPEPRTNRAERRDDFSRWSGTSFPPDFENEIINFNRANGKSAQNSLGYRWFYWRYVEGLDFDEIQQILDESDS